MKMRRARSDAPYLGGNAEWRRGAHGVTRPTWGEMQNGDAARTSAYAKLRRDME
jgi:hypothetical protein